ncbi:MAG: hypothetical protein WCJ54_02105 [Actinomycetota bacterium]
MAKNKMEDIYNDLLGSKPKSIKEELKESPKKGEESFVRATFFISKNQREKLKNYTQNIAPPHIKISQSELIRFMIENFDIEAARQNYFKIK